MSAVATDGALVLNLGGIIVNINCIDVKVRLIHCIIRKGFFQIRKKPYRPW